MIEKLVTGFIAKLENNNQFIKLKDDEINRLIRVESLLVKDYSGAPPTIAALSKIAAMSPTKLKRDFKAMYGLPIYEYYQKNRMIRARSLLLEGKYAVKEVGIMVGYSNLGHFAGSFRKEFGLLPSEIVNEETGNYASAKDIQPHDWSKN
nr:AraC family transcriptional regulator [Panacibacter microcysteis]